MIAKCQSLTCSNQKVLEATKINLPVSAQKATTAVETVQGLDARLESQKLDQLVNQTPLH